MRSYFFPKGESVLSSARLRGFFRTLLRAYVDRLCDVRLDEVARLELALKELPPFDGLVEEVYEAEESLVLTGLQAIRDGADDISDEDAAAAITLHLIRRQQGMEASGLA